MSDRRQGGHAMNNLKLKPKHFVSDTCKGERCFCGKDATHKVGEEISDSDPYYRCRHNFTQYVCCQCFVNIVGDAAFCGLTRNNNKWTYCEDALPSKDGDYEVTVHAATANRTFVQWSMWAGIWDIEGEDEDYKVIAWMPLPKPAEPKEAK